MLVVVSAFFVLRFGIDSRNALIAAQFVYLVGPVSACCLPALAGRAEPRGARAGVVWSLMAVASGLVTVSVSIYSYYTVVGGPVPNGPDRIADAFNLLAVLAFLALVGTIVHADRLGRRRQLAFGLDLIIVVVLSFTVVYRFAVTPLFASVSHADLVDAVRHAAYSSVGVAFIASAIFGAMSVRGRVRSWEAVMYAAFLVFGTGLTLWPLWELAASSVDGVPTFAEPATTMLYLIGYLLFAASAAERLRSRDEPWHVSLSLERPRLVWPGMAAATLVFAAVGVLTWSVVNTEAADSDRAVYFSGATIAALAMVGRTALTTIELDEAQQSSAVDALTGALNSRMLSERVEELLTRNRRLGEPFAIVMVDVDDLAEINQQEGARRGDQVLTELAGVLGRTCGYGNVFRLSGDEFAVLIPGAESSKARAAAIGIVHAVKEASPAEMPVTVSIGFAASVAESGSTDAQRLLMRAESAQQAAKRHGKNRVVGFDERDAEEAGTPSLSALKEGPARDIARTLAAAADARDPANYRHSRNVAALSMFLARARGFDAERAYRVEVAGMLHDVGKIALPDTMLGNRTVPFKDRRRAEEHAALGERLVASLGLPEVSAWVRSHHERWDGLGYPDGLKGEAIPLESRIVALADAYDGMTTGKQYGAPMSKAAALQEIDLGMGTRFDPELAELFIRIVGTTSALGWSDGWFAA